MYLQSFEKSSKYISLFQATTLLQESDTFFIGILCLSLKWIPCLQITSQIFAYQNPKRISEALISTLLHPAMLSFYQLKNIWKKEEKTEEMIKEYQILRGCVESPILFVIQGKDGFKHSNISFIFK